MFVDWNGKFVYKYSHSLNYSHVKLRTINHTFGDITQWSIFDEYPTLQDKSIHGIEFSDMATIYLIK